MSKSPLMQPKLLMNVIIVTCVLAAVTILLEIWLSLFSADALYKLLVTYGIVAVLASILRAIKSDMDDDEKQEDENYYN